MARLVKLKAFAAEDHYPLIAKKPPQLLVRRAARKPRTRLGYCESGGYTISVTIYPGQTEMDARETLLHELAHAVVERTLRGAGDWHGRYWQSVFASACKEAYGLTIRVDSAYHGKFKKAAAERDERG